MKLKFSNKTRSTKIDPVIQRREKLISRIDQQAGFVRQLISGEQPRAAWVWMAEDGTYYLPIKYGKRVLEIQKDKVSIECANLAEVENALGEIRSMVLHGKLDGPLAHVASDIRTRFQHSQKLSK